MENVLRDRTQNLWSCSFAETARETHGLLAGPVQWSNQFGWKYEAMILEIATSIVAPADMSGSTQSR